MPYEEMFEELKARQLNKELRVSTEDTAAKLRQKDRDLYDKRSIRQDIRDIRTVMKGDLTEEERAELEMIQGRNLSSLLILEEKTTGDSKQMKRVKKSLSAVEKEVNKDRLGVPFTDQDMDNILSLYDTAILACADYMKDKTPAYTTGEERRRLVELNMLRLHKEARAFLVAKELLKRDMLSRELNTARELMVQARGYTLIRKEKQHQPGQKADQPKGQEAPRELPDEDTLKRSGYEASVIYRIFSGKERPSDLISRLMKSKKKADQDFGQELLYFFGNIRNSLADFREGKVTAKVFLIGKTVLSVYQNAFGQLTLRAGVTELPLDRHTGIIADMLALDIVKNESLYGKKATEQVIREAMERMDVTRPGAKERQLFTDYLVQHTRYSVADLNNFMTGDLSYMIQALMKGKKLYIVDASDIMERWEFTDNDVIFAKDHGRMINGMEIRQLLQETEANRQAVKDKVLLAEEKEEKIAEKKKSEPEEEEAPEWEEKEQKVVNLLGDLIFSYDSWTADEKLEEPGKRMQLMLAKNAEGLALILSDMFVTGEANLKMINGMLDKMPLFMMEKKEAEEFRRVVTDGLKKAAEAIKKEVDQRILEVLGDRPEGFFEGIGYDTKKALITTAANMHLVTPQSLLKGISIPGTELKVDGLKDILLKLDKEVIASLAETEKSIDTGVKETAKTIQETVSRYSGELFKPDNKTEAPVLPNPDEPGIDKDEVKRRKRERYELGNQYLGNMVKDSMTSGESGQGLFTKLVFDHYFSGVDTMDQRAMLASMIRNAKPVRKLLNEEEKNISKEEKERRKTYNEKVMTESMGNYIGGLLKGAGPLFQKMMQGLPVEGLPDALKSAVKDMKSKLAPIPQELVEAQLYSMVQRSHGQIRAIRMVKPLGAASVGQTFLCRITRADGKEEEVAVKLLKPDVTNRMMREKQLMIRCARMTDMTTRRQENERRRAEHLKPLPEIGAEEKGGMQETYEGQLERIQEELDLTIEARNVELGAVYDKAETEEEKKVTSMKLSTLIAPTTNSMVVEKAPGDTIDSLLEQAKEETKQIREIFRRRILPSMSEEQKKDVERRLQAGDTYYSSTTAILEAEGLDLTSEKAARIQPAVLEERLSRLLGELKKKKEYLDTYARKWTDEGLFRGGFYHGDPHAGNIMVSDEKLTVIDFGNCTQLSDEQQLYVTRMMAAASTGNMELFRSGLHALLNPKFEALYQQKRTQLGDAIREVFKYGDQRSAGSRIMVALLKAQELGLEIPSAVYNFSQGQLRLQNAISDMNAQIEDTSRAVMMMTEKFGDLGDFDLSDKAREKAALVADADSPGDAYMRQLAKDYQTEKALYMNTPEEMKDFTVSHYSVVKTTFIGPLKRQAEAKATILKNFRDLANARKILPKEEIPNYRWKEAMDIQFNAYNRIVDGEMRSRIVQGFHSMEYTDEWADAMEKEISDRADQARAAADTFAEAEQIREEVKQRNKGEWKPTEEETARFDTACDTFARAFMPVYTEMTERSDAFRKCFTSWAAPEHLEEGRQKAELFFKIYPEGRETFMKAFHTYTEAVKEKDKDPAAFTAAEKALMRVYHDLMYQRIKKRAEIYQGAAENSDSDFLDIMAGVLQEELPKFISRLGYIRAISVGRKMNKQRDEAIKLGIMQE